MTRAAPRELDEIVWNAKVGRYPSAVVGAVASMIDDHSPQVLALLEAGAYAPALKRAFGDDYRIVGRGTDVVAMLRRDLPVRRVTAVRVAGPWWGPKQLLRHDGRNHLLVDLGHTRQLHDEAADEHPWRRLYVHRIPGGPTGGVQTRGANQPTWLREHNRISHIAHQAGSRRRAFGCLGDQNAEIRDDHGYGPRRLADSLNATLYRTGRKVDWGWGWGARCDALALDDFGSDHHAVLYQSTHKGA